MRVTCKGIEMRVWCLQITGDGTEAQTLMAGRQYLSRPSMMESILNTLYTFFRFDKCHDARGALDVILAAMDRYPAEKVIQISGSACICYVINTPDALERINVRVKRKIFSTLLNGMLAHSDDPVMMRNGCLALSQFRYTGDFVSCFFQLNSSAAKLTVKCSSTRAVQ